jgi:hypothetical protein
MNKRYFAGCLILPLGSSELHDTERFVPQPGTTVVATSGDESTSNSHLHVELQIETAGSTIVPSSASGDDPSRERLFRLQIIPLPGLPTVMLVAREALDARTTTNTTMERVYWRERIKTVLSQSGLPRGPLQAIRYAVFAGTIRQIRGPHSFGLFAKSELARLDMRMPLTLSKIINAKSVIRDTLPNSEVVSCPKCDQTYRLGYSGSELSRIGEWVHRAKSELDMDHHKRHDAPTILLHWLVSEKDFERNFKYGRIVAVKTSKRRKAKTVPKPVYRIKTNVGFRRSHFYELEAQSQKQIFSVGEVIRFRIEGDWAHVQRSRGEAKLRFIRFSGKL